MTQRFHAVAGFLAAATLLSGSAFGFAPEFDQDFPTVIITDKLPGADSGTPYDVNGVGAAATEYVFRFSHAVELQSRVTNLQGNTFNQLKFDFNEFDDDADTTPNTVHTLLINGHQATDSVPDGTAVGASGYSLTERYADGGLDFRNRDFSGDDESINSGFDSIGGETGQDIDLSDPQQRVVSLYIKGDTSTDLAIRSFLVITTRGGEDELTTVATGPANITTPVYEQDNFNGWQSGAFGSLVGVPANSTNYDVFGTGATTGYTFTPNVTPATTAHSSISVASNTTQIGYATWVLNPLPSVSLEANALYRLRANIYSPVTTSNEQVRISIGDQFRSGLSTVNYGDNSQVTQGGKSQLSSSSSNIVSVYLLAEGAAPSPQVSAEVVTFGNLSTGGGADYTIGDITVDKFINGISDLGTPSIVKNHGGAVTGEIDPVVDPASSPTAFDLSASPVLGLTWEYAKVNAAAVGAGVLSASTLAVTYGAQGTDPNTAPAAPSYSAVALKGGNTTHTDEPGSFAVSAGKLYRVDVWMSTDTVKTTELSMPDLRLDVLQHGTQAAFLTQVLAPKQGANNLPAALGTAPRAYTLFWEPQTGYSTSPANLQLNFLSFGKAYTTLSRVIIHRVTVYEYPTAPGL